MLLTILFTMSQTELCLVNNKNEIIMISMIIHIPLNLDGNKNLVL